MHWTQKVRNSFASKALPLTNKLSTSQRSSVSNQPTVHHFNVDPEAWLAGYMLILQNQADKPKASKICRDIVSVHSRVPSLDTMPTTASAMSNYNGQ